MDWCSLAHQPMCLSFLLLPSKKIHFQQNWRRCLFVWQKAKKCNAWKIQSKKRDFKGVFPTKTECNSKGGSPSPLYNYRQLHLKSVDATPVQIMVGLAGSIITAGWISDFQIFCFHFRCQFYSMMIVGVYALFETVKGLLFVEYRIICMSSEFIFRF